MARIRGLAAASGNEPLGTQHRNDGLKLRGDAFRRREYYLAAQVLDTIAPALSAVASLRGKAPSEPHTWRRGLILGDTHIGDVLCRTASLEQLSARLPQCQWDYLCSPMSAQVLAGNPHLHAVLPWRLDDTVRLSVEHRSALRARDYDVALLTNATRYWPLLLLAWRLDIPNRVSFVHKGLSSLVTHPVPIAFPDTFAGYARQVVAHITGSQGRWDLRPQVYPAPQDHREAEALWRQVGGDTTQPTLACFVTSRQPRGVVAFDRFGPVLEAVHAARPVRVVLLGGTADGHTLESLARSLSFPVHVAPGLGLLGVVSFLRRCSVVMSTDSGPRHLANAAGTPVVFIRNISAHAAETGTYCASEVDAGPSAELVAESDEAAVFSRLSAESIAARVLQQIAVSDSRQPAGHSLMEAAQPSQQRGDGGA
jgi:ADP-heptose:LPS heptosyltransferase